jgi:hypothetical protein
LCPKFEVCPDMGHSTEKGWTSSSLFHVAREALGVERRNERRRVRRGRGAGQQAGTRDRLPVGSHELAQVRVLEQF